MRGEWNPFQRGHGWRETASASACGAATASAFEDLAARGRRELAAGRPGEAASFLGTALGLWRGEALSSELGTEDYLYLSKARLARERRRSGDLEGAFRDLYAAHRQARERGQLRLEANILVGLANVHRRAGDLAQSDATLDRLEALGARRPALKGLARDLIVSTRIENRLAAGDAVRARAMLPEAAGALFGQGAGAGLAWVAELLGGIRTVEGAPEEGSRSLGMSQVMRGAFDHGEPEWRELVERIVAALGRHGFETEYARGAAYSRDDALRWLEAETLRST
ncbi:BTAD domain-containing putative transcriptional regulator [Streptomyces goshikiensis]|uniref:BTAD domain-containing putative transcriptional regulator n=1 Tax=Streptomyces goshikiensis TaxID=1942 RepID=UPI00331B5040